MHRYPNSASTKDPVSKGVSASVQYQHRPGSRPHHHRQDRRRRQEAVVLRSSDIPARQRGGGATTIPLISQQVRVRHYFQNASDTDEMQIVWTYSSVDATRTVVATGVTTRIDEEHDTAVH